MPQFEALKRAAAVHRGGDLAQALELYNAVIADAPTYSDAYHLKGVAYLDMGDRPTAQKLIRHAVSLNPQDPNFHNSLGEALRRNGSDAEAAEATSCFRRSIDLDPSNAATYNNLALALEKMGDVEGAFGNYKTAVQLDADYSTAATNLANLHCKHGNVDRAREIYASLMTRLPLDYDVHWEAALHLHMAGYLSEAIEIYEKALALRPTDVVCLLNLGGARQEQGRFREAIVYYQAILRIDPTDGGALNNMGGALMLIGEQEKALQYLHRALELEPDSYNALVNLGVHFQNQGDLAMATKLFRRALRSDPTKHALEIQISFLLPPVMLSTAEAQRSRAQFEANLDRLLRWDNITIAEPLRSLEQTSKFYIQYHGVNDRPAQTKIATLMRRASPGLSYVAPFLAHPRPKGQLLHVGFVSKFFVVNHAHGELIRGVVSKLPRDRFRVTLFNIANPREPLSQPLMDSADEVVTIALSLAEAREAIAARTLDVLVFADIVSEQMNYFLAFARLARVQCLFWGNPITSGIETMDYFLTALATENMEQDITSHYSEQPLLLGGQGIWYEPIDTPDPAELPRRSVYGFSDDWVLYTCPQSVFKLHPDYDLVLKRILSSVPNSHIFFVEGRQKAWTNQVRLRMNNTMPELKHRIHFVPRVPGSKPYLKLISVADVMLHPFPFGGSKTSSDALAMGIPLVVFKAKYLRGHMAPAFYHQMGMSDVIAKTVDEYVELAIRLAQPRYRAQFSARIKANVHRIWRDMVYVRDWQKFFERAVAAVTFTAPLDPTLPPALRSAPQPYRHPSLARRPRDNAPSVATNSVPKARSRLLSVKPTARPRLLKIKPRVVTKAVEPRLVRPVSSGASPQEAALRLGVRAVQLNREGRLAESAELLRQAIELAPTAPNFRNDYGAVLKNQWKLPEARDAFLAAIRLRPDYGTAYQNLGVTCAALRKFPEAFAAYDKALELLPGKRDQLLYNVGGLLRDSRDPQPVAKMAKLAGMQSLEKQPGLLEAVVTLALADVQPVHRAAVEAYGRATRLGITLDQQTLFDLVMHLKRNFAEATNMLAYHLIKQGRMLNSAVVLASVAAAHHVFTPRVEAPHEAVCGGAEAGSQCLGVHLITQYYRSQSASRQAEIDEVLFRNINNPRIAHVHLLVERAFDLGPMAGPRVSQHVVGRRLTFQTAFAYAQLHLQGKAVMLGNADLYFDHSLDNIPRVVRPEQRQTTVMALLRWERERVDGTRAPELRPRIDQQDVWVFFPPLRQSLLQGVSAFELGKLRCDNRIAAVLSDHGYTVINPAMDVVAWHVQQSRKRQYKEVDEVSGRGQFVAISLPLPPL